MNSMSISPVKPPLNPGNLAVPPATATNLTKSAIPPNNSFTALNLVPENKGAAPVPSVPTTSDKLVESPVKASLSTPTSNGSVSPLADTGQSAAVPTAVPSVQNCNEKNEVAENLSISNAAPKVESSVEEPPKPKIDIEKKKEEKKPIPEMKGSSSDIKAAPSKDTTTQNVSIIDAPSTTEKFPVKKDVSEEKKKDEKKTETTSLPAGTVQAENVTSSPGGKESVEPAPTKVVQEEKKPGVTSTAKEGNESAKTDVEPALKKKAESSSAVEPAPVKTESTSKTTSPPKAIKRKAKGPVESIAEEENADGRKSKRTRLPTQPYQSPIPELQLIAKMNTPTKATPKTSNDKIIAFYKNEFLAVRNPEGSFYICQTFQNIHRSSSKIKIRWFSNLPQNIYTPDFYDRTEFDCILTNVTMNRVEKDRWKLPDAEQIRIENILKRALDVEKGVAEQPSVTEEHPDGLDLSLYKDEAQLQKRKKKVAASPKKTTPPEPKKAMKSKKVSKPPPKTAAVTSSAGGVKKSPRVSSYVNRDSTEGKSKVVEKGAKVDKSAKTAEKSVKKDKKKKKSKTSKKPASNSAATKAADSSSKTWEPSVKASNSSKVVLSLRKEESSPTKSSTASESKGTKRTSSVSLRASAAAASAATPAATSTSPAKRKKEEPKTSPNNSTTATATEKTGKVRNAGSAVSAKINSAAIRTTKEKERKAAAATSQRKK